VKSADLIRAAAQSGAMVMLTHRAMAMLVDELGERRAGRLLLELATETQRPIAVNVPDDPSDPDGESTTLMIPPIGWSEERVRGWIGGQHEEIEAAFGQVAGVRRLA